MLCFYQITTCIFHPTGMITFLRFPHQCNSYDSSTTLNVHSAAEGVILLPCHGPHRHRNLHLNTGKRFVNSSSHSYLVMRDRHPALTLVRLIRQEGSESYFQMGGRTGGSLRSRLCKCICVLI